MEMEKNDKAMTVEEEPAVKHRGWKAMPYIIGNETFEKLGTLGTSSNLLVYLTTIFHMNSANATILLQIFQGTTNLAPIFGAFLCDTFFGRFITLGFATMSSLTGMLILTLTATITKLHPSKCSKGQNCEGATPWQLTVLLSSFAFLIIGAGGIRPCNLAFGADQFDPRTESGKKGITSFFNWYYFTFTFAMMISSTVIIYIQSDVSWSLGFLIPAVLMFFSGAFFFIGSPLYVKVKPEGSPFTSIAQVITAAVKKRGLKLSNEPDHQKLLFNPPHVSLLNSKLPYTDQFRFLDKASIILPTDDIKSNGSAHNPWRLCTLQQVEEVKCLLRIIPVWSAGIIFATGTSLQGNYAVFEAMQSDRHLWNTSFEIPAGSFSVFGMLALTIWIPFYDRIMVPWFRRFTGREEGISLLQRMGIGIVISIIGFITAGLIEERRRSFAFQHPTIGVSSGGGAISSLSSLWLIPQLVLIGLSEAFNAIGQIEFYYKQFPENMRSIAGSVFFLSLAASSYLGSFMVSIVHKTTGGNGKRNWLAQDLNEGRLDYFYFVIAALGVLNLMYFIACASWYRYKDLTSGGEVAMEVRTTKQVEV